MAGKDANDRDSGFHSRKIIVYFSSYYFWQGAHISGFPVYYITYQVMHHNDRVNRDEEMPASAQVKRETLHAFSTGEAAVHEVFSEMKQSCLPTWHSH